MGNSLNISVLGAGSWGTALAILLARNGHHVYLWDHFSDHINHLIKDRENRRYLPKISLPDTIVPTADLAECLSNPSIILVVVPSHAFSKVIHKISNIIPEGAILSWATKGFEPDSGRLLSQVAQEICHGKDITIISGPTFANEVAKGLPTALTVASTNADHAHVVADALHSDSLRAYTSSDIIGVQVGAAVKNVMAIAAGIADGLGFGANTRAALITRGLAEITRLGMALDGSPETFMGLTGLGDLALTCTDNQSRNRRMGLALAAGKSVDQAKIEIGQEVEGVGTTQVVYLLAKKLNVDMPITEQVYNVLYQNLAPQSAVYALLGRRQKSESERP